KGQPGKALDFLEVDGAHVKAGMRPEDLDDQYQVAAAEIAITNNNWLDLTKHGEALRDHSLDSYKRHLGRIYMAIASVHNENEDVRVNALASCLEPWGDMRQYRSTLRLALKAIIDLFDAGWPEGADATLWIGRVRDGCLQLAKDGA